MLTVKQTANVMLGANTEAAKLAAEITAGNVLNDRLAKMVTPQLPAMAKLYANTALGKALIANAFAAGLVHFLPTNDKAAKASGMMVNAAMLELAGTFNIEDMVDEFLDGVKLPGTTEVKKAVNDVDLIGMYKVTPEEDKEGTA